MCCLCSDTFDRFVLKVLLYKIKWKSSTLLDEGENQLRLALPELSAEKEQIDDQTRQVMKRTTATVRCNDVHSL
jgi:hypothetical protein